MAFWWHSSSDNSKKTVGGYTSGSELYANNASYRRAVDRLVRSARKPDLVLDASGPVVPGATATTGVPLAKINDPAKYFTDKLIRSPVKASWWSEQKLLLSMDPFHLIWVALEGTFDAVKWVGWNYLDLVDQWKSWDGTLTGLFTHSELIWRTLISAALTTGLALSGPLLVAVTEWAGLLGRLLMQTFEIVGDILTELWKVVEGIIEFISKMSSSRGR